MYKITIEKCIKQVNNKFDLVLIASKRAKNIITGKSKTFIKNNNIKPSVLALKEIENGYYNKVLDDINKE